MSTLDHYNSYQIDSTQYWPGLKSSKFGPTRYHVPHSDLISSGINIPHQGYHHHNQRKHLSQKRSQQQQFRPSIRKLPEMQHWKLRQSSIRTIQFQPSYRRRRPERLHLRDSRQMHEIMGGIRTYRNQRIKQGRQYEYSVEDRMQRKTRINLSQLRSSRYGNPQTIF